jgi:hypothetical protein
MTDLPLPEPAWVIGGVSNMPPTLYTADQLHAYAAAKTAALEAECARLRANIEAAARYGWEHPKWEWSAVKGGLDRFIDAALRGKE